MTYSQTIAIDGPAASGKTTIGRMLAEQLGYLFMDTGCMYRAVTLAVLRQGVDVLDETAVTQLAQDIEIDIQPIGDKQDGRFYTVILEEEDVTWEIRSAEVDACVSQISKYAGVRQEMVQRQRTFGQNGRVVMVGRDIGTVVLPHASLKLYITASPNERAKRRWLERQKRGHQDILQDILADVIRRDEIDSSRQHSPLRPAADAIIIDTTGREPQAVLQQLITLVALETEPL